MKHDRTLLVLEKKTVFIAIQMASRHFTVRLILLCVFVITVSISILKVLGFNFRQRLEVFSYLIGENLEILSVLKPSNDNE